VLNSRGSRSAVLATALLFLCWSGAKAQGLYYNYYIDGSYVGTEMDGYPGTGCAGSLTNMWSSFQTSYDSGFAPVSFSQSAPTVDGGYYSWSIGFSIQYPDPYTGACDTENFSEVLFAGPLRKIIAYYYAAGSSGGNYLARRCNPNNACDGLIGGIPFPAFALTTVYQINIGLALQCGIPRDMPPSPRLSCLAPDPLP
jgi:hypothetical protein